MKIPALQRLAQLFPLQARWPHPAPERPVARPAADAWSGSRNQPTTSSHIGRAVNHLSAAPMRPGNRIDLLIDGKQVYPEIERMVAAAKTRVDFEFFSFFDDETGNRLADQLIKKAREGVEVNVMLNYYGTLTNRSMIKRMRDAGVRVTYFSNGNRFPALAPSDAVDHRKIILVDGKQGMTGGMNLGKAYEKYWHDFMVKVEGPALHDMYREFNKNWGMSRGASLRRVAVDTTPKGSHAAQVSVTTPKAHEIKQSMLQAFDSARHNIKIQSPYIPDKQVVATLKRAAARGVEVTVLMPTVGDNPIVDKMNQMVTNELLASGVKVYLYNTANPDGLPKNHKTDKFNHGKVATVDDVWTTIGTANADTRSMDKNQEINLNIDSEAFTREVNDRIFKYDIETNSQPAVPYRFRKRSRPIREGLDLIRPLVIVPLIASNSHNHA